MAPPRCVVFDFGNVIAFFDHMKACRQLVPLSSSGMDAGAVHAAVFGSTLEADYDSGRLSTAEFLEQLRKVLTLRGSDDDISRAWCDIYSPNESIARLIHALKAQGTRLVLGSNTNALHHEWFQRQFAATLAHFDVQVVSYRVGCRKPDRRFFDACIAASEGAADECVYIDDRQDLVAAGTARGMNGIVYTPGLDLTPRLGVCY
jgi:putative hydrolase of the HAD superfamily